MAEQTPIVICGLDGVLALIEHRLHHLYNDEGEKHWERFYAACSDDMPNLPLIDRLNLARREGVPVVIITGRSASAREKTLQWLCQWSIAYDDLWMRPANNFRPTEEFKAAIIEQHYAAVPIRRVYEAAQHLNVARWCEDHNIPYTLVGPNQGNGEGRELFELQVVNHACGHTSLYPFYGDDDLAWAERATQLGESPCRVCLAKEQDEERRKKAVQAKFHAQQRGLPPLEGSDKQTAWAETIRLGAFASIDKVMKWVVQVDVKAAQEDPDHWSTVKQGIQRSITYLEQQCDAKWWIDHRHGMMNNLDGGRALLSAIAEEMGFY